MNLREVAANQPPRRASAILAGWFLRAIGGVFLAVAFGLFVASAGGTSFDFLARLALGGGSALSGVVGTALWQLGKQFSAKAAAARGPQDPRPPVVYLRAFAADDLTAKGTASSAVFLQESIDTEEEQLAKVVEDIGPLVAVGRPAESLPALGATRVYHGDDKWKSAVARMVRSAALVVIRIGATDGLLWEVRHVASKVEPRRLVLLVPADRQAYDAFVRAMRWTLPCALPDYPADAGSSRVGSLVGIVYFSDEWKPQLVKLQGVGLRVNFSGRLGPALALALGPVCARLASTAVRPDEVPPPSP